MSGPEYYIDSNVFIRLFVNDNEKMHAECRTLIDLMRQKRINAGTSALVLAEVQWVLGSFYAFPKHRVIEALKGIAPLTLLYDDVPECSTAIALYEAHAVKFIDALIASHPRLQDGSMAVISYDRDFDKLGLRRMEPREVVAKVI